MYFMPAYDQRYYYELTLPEGVYSYIMLDNRDTIEFAVNKEGVFKLGFYENHPDFVILRDSLP